MLQHGQFEKAKHGYVARGSRDEVKIPLLPSVTSIYKGDRSVLSQRSGSVFAASIYRNKDQINSNLMRIADEEMNHLANSSGEKKNLNQTQ